MQTHTSECASKRDWGPHRERRRRVLHAIVHVSKGAGVVGALVCSRGCRRCRSLGPGQVALGWRLHLRAAAGLCCCSVCVGVTADLDMPALHCKSAPCTARAAPLSMAEHGQPFLLGSWSGRQVMHAFLGSSMAWKTCCQDPNTRKQGSSRWHSNTWCMRMACSDVGGAGQQETVTFFGVVPKVRLGDECPGLGPSDAAAGSLPPWCHQHPPSALAACMHIIHIDTCTKAQCSHRHAS